MKLTRYDKQVFIRNVLADVPQVDYEDTLRKKVVADAISKLPEEIKKVYADPLLRDYVVCTYANIPIPMKIGYHPQVSIHVPGVKYQVPKQGSLAIEINDLAEKIAAQRTALSDLEIRLRNTSEPITTLARLKQVFPELEKYMPKEPHKTQDLPASNDVMVSLKNMGFPKGKAVA